MSKSLKRVAKEAEELGLGIQIIQLEIQTKTAAQAADAMGCSDDQILKSIIFLGQNSGKCVLFMTAGGNRVDVDKASAFKRALPLVGCRRWGISRMLRNSSIHA